MCKHELEQKRKGPSGPGKRRNRDLPVPGKPTAMVLLTCSRSWWLSIVSWSHLWPRSQGSWRRRPGAGGAPALAAAPGATYSALAWGRGAEGGELGGDGAGRFSCYPTPKRWVIREQCSVPYTNLLSTRTCAELLPHSHIPNLPHKASHGPH